MNAKKLIYEQKLEQADKILTQEIDKGVFHSDLFYLYAELKRLQGEYQESEFQFKNCISAKTHSPYVYFGLGLIYAQQSDFNQAIQMFRTFVELIVFFYLQDTVDGRFHLAKSLIAINENLEASIHLTKAVELFKQQQLLGQEKVQQLILLHVLRADVYESLGFDELAVEDYRKVREIDPKFYKEYLIEAEKLEAQGNFIEGERIRNFVRKLFM